MSKGDIIVILFVALSTIVYFGFATYVSPWINQCTNIICECHDNRFTPYKNDTVSDRAYKTFLSNFIKR